MRKVQINITVDETVQASGVEKSFQAVIDMKDPQTGAMHFHKAIIQEVAAALHQLGIEYPPND